MSRPWRTLSLCFLALGTAAASYASWSKVEPDLLQQVKTSGSQKIRVLVMLHRQHAAEAADHLAQNYSPLLDQLSRQVTQAAQASRHMPTLMRSEEVLFAAQMGQVFQATTLKPLTQQIDAVRTQYADAIARRAVQTSAMDFAALESWVRSLGGTVVDKTVVVSALIVDLPANRVGDLSRSALVGSIGREHEATKDLNISAQAMLANSFWSNGSTGGPADVGVLDTGVQHNHPAFTGFRWEASTQTDSDGHGSHVAGIMASKDSTYRGMAWGADTISVYATGTETQSMVGLNWLMTNVTEKAEDVNHSFGYGTATTTDYRNTDMFFDGACDNFSFLVSKSNGNNGYGTTTLTHPAPAFNLIAVASMNDLNTPARSDDRISSYSSCGPTLGGRKKPDLAAPGEGIMSVNRAGGFVSLSGTSMAAPHAGGSVILLMGLGSPSPMAAKATLINTADAMTSRNTASAADDAFVPGSNWDKAYGWGYINLSNAYLHAPDVFERTLTAPTATKGTFRLFKGQMFTNDKATLTWNRHVVYNGSNYPNQVRQLSNLNLLAFRAETSELVASSQSTIDNVEQLAVPTDTQTVLKVVTNGLFDVNVANERFALATEEDFVEAAGPNTSGTWFKLPSANYVSPFPLTVTITNTGDLPIVSGKATLANYVVVSGANPQSIGTLLPGQSVQVNWTVRRAFNTGNVRATTTVESNAYGELWSWVLTDPNPL